MPPIGWLLSGVDFANLFILLRYGRKHGRTRLPYKSLTQAKEDGAVVIRIGLFLNSVINFLVISGIIFVLLRPLLKGNDKSSNKDSSKSNKKCTYCFMKINRKAVKCPYCTSDVSSKEKQDQSTVEDTTNTLFNSPQQNNAQNDDFDDKDDVQQNLMSSKKALKKSLKKNLSFSDLSST